VAFLRDRIATLLASGPRSAAEIARELGAVPGSVRRELVALRDSGRAAALDGRYSLTEGLPVPVERAGGIRHGTLAAEILAILRARYTATLEKYEEYAEQKRFLRVPVYVEACLKPAAIAYVLGQPGGAVRSRLSELLRGGYVEKHGDCYKIRSVLGRRQSATVAQTGGWRVRLYKDEAGIETAVVAPFGQERKRLKHNAKRENYALDLYVVGSAGLKGPFVRAQKAFGNSYGRPLEVVAYATTDFTVIDIDVKRYPRIREKSKREKVIKIAKASGAIGYEVTRGGGLHLFYPDEAQIPQEVKELQDPVYQSISERRGFYATRPYDLRRIDEPPTKGSGKRPRTGSRRRSKSKA